MDIQELQENIGRATSLMEMLAHRHRLHVLCSLLEGEKSVLTLVDEIGMSQPAVSHHLKKLRDNGLVTTRREAQTIFYSLEGIEVKSVLAVLHELYCSD